MKNIGIIETATAPQPVNTIETIANQNLKLMKIRTNRSTSLAALLSAVTLATLSLSASAVVVDGIFDSNEGYANVLSLQFQLDNGKMVKDPGTLAWNVDTQGNVTVAFVQPLSINDNTYGANSIGWNTDPKKSGGHSFNNLVGSDKAQIDFTNAAGQAFSITLDYISKSTSAPSGYASLGVTGGDGGLGGGKKGGGSITAAQVVKWGSSLDYNLNILGFKNFITDSPATTPSLNPDGSIDYSKAYANPSNAPGWVYNISYEVEIAASAFGPSGFGGVTVPFAHDSPSKLGQNTIIVVPEPGNYVVGLAALALLAGTQLKSVLKRKRQHALKRI